MQHAHGHHNGNRVFAGCCNCNLYESEFFIVAYAVFLIFCCELDSFNPFFFECGYSALAAIDEWAFPYLPHLGLEEGILGPWEFSGFTISGIYPRSAVSCVCFPCLRLFNYPVLQKMVEMILCLLL